MLYVVFQQLRERVARQAPPKSVPASES